MKIAIALFPRIRDVYSLEREDLTWDELVSVLSTHDRRTVKDGPYWCPAEFEPCPATCRSTGDGKCSGSMHHRIDGNVVRLTAAVFDLDSDTGAAPLRLERLRQVLDGIKDAGVACFAYSSFSHAPPEKCKVRLIFPLTRPVLRGEWRRFWGEVVRRFNLPADPSGKNESRAFYLPSAPPGAEVFIERIDGDPIGVDSLLRKPSPPPMSDEPKAFDLKELAARIKSGAGQRNAELVRSALDGKPLSPPRSGPYGGQDQELQALMSSVAFCLPNDTPDEVVLALLRPCFAATEWGEGTEHLCHEALKKLYRARERKVARDTATLDEVNGLLAKLGFDRGEVEEAPVDEGLEHPEAWMGRLITNEGVRLAEADPEKPVRLKKCEANIHLILKNAPGWKGTLRFNEVSKRVEIQGAPLDVRTTLDTLDAAIAIWLQQSDWGRLGLYDVKANLVREVLLLVAQESGHDPLRAYLEGVVWDGKPRAATFLERYFGAKGDPVFLRAVSAKWLISAAARALHPGCKVDTMLILEGLQGKKKSTAFGVLGGEWFTDTPLDIGDKDSWALASTKWVIEFAEVQTFKRSTADQLKGFLSRATDDYRPPYARVSSPWPRRCVFVGTTNDPGYLRRDPSGYRRFWTVGCTTVDIDGLRQDRDQLWAEAVARFKAGEQWWLTDEEGALAETAALDRSEVQGDTRRDAILDWLLRMEPSQRPREVTLLRVAEQALGSDKAHITATLEREIAEAMHELGFGRRIQETGGVRRRVWTVPESLRSAAKVAVEGTGPSLKVAK
jgi:predicted P-loop ATPase